ncbi:MAG: hypothetical protein J6P29_02005 [Acetobacter sp.]|nr:hypothetical protein [Acetobacter sp.]
MQKVKRFFSFRKYSSRFRYDKKGSIAIEATICIIVGLVMLVGVVDIVLEMQAVLRVNALASHVARMIVSMRDDTPTTIYFAMKTALQSEGEAVYQPGLAVTIVPLSGASPQVYYAGAGCPNWAGERAEVMMSGVFSTGEDTYLGGASAIVAVDACRPEKSWFITLNLLKFTESQLKNIHAYSMLLLPGKNSRTFRYY